MLENMAGSSRMSRQLRVNVSRTTGSDHIFKFQEAEILAGGDNRVSRGPPESWFSGSQSSNKPNDLPLPYAQPRFSLGREISHVGSARPSDYPGDSEPICRAIVTPASSTDGEILAVDDSDADSQATVAAITTPAGILTWQSRPSKHSYEGNTTKKENRLGHAQIIQFLKLCLKTYFTFDRTIYEQLKGTPMGSPISGLIAEAVLKRLE
nr:unnamed protein product [Spirometra erinaceieuropaei]